jgi:hypothetical protein
MNEGVQQQQQVEEQRHDDAASHHATYSMHIDDDEDHAEPAVQPMLPPAAAAAHKAAKRIRRQAPSALQGDAAAAGMQLLSLVLQHAGPAAAASSANTVCSMLCCSKAMQALMHRHLQGQLVVSVPSGAEPAPLAQWISEHGCLLQQLQLGLDHLWGDAAQSIAAAATCGMLAAALHNAAAAPLGLQLQSFSCSYPSAVLLDAMQQTSSSSLTSLQVSLTGGLEN